MVVSVLVINDVTLGLAWETRTALARAAVPIVRAASTREDDLKMALAVTALRDTIEASIAQLSSAQLRGMYEGRECEVDRHGAGWSSYLASVDERLIR